MQVVEVDHAVAGYQVVGGGQLELRHEAPAGTR